MVKNQRNVVAECAIISASRSGATNTPPTLTNPSIEVMNMANASLPNTQLKRKRGRPRGIKSPWVELRDQTIIETFSAGAEIKTIAQSFGLSPQRIRNILHLSGIDVREAQKQRTLARKPVKPTYEERFWARVAVGAEDACWEWQGYKHPNGYGRASYKGTAHWVHRIAFALHHGQMPKLHVLHSCDSPPCCNPAHLREGTPADNMRDRDIRGRAGWQKDYDGWRSALKRGQAKRADNRRRKITFEQAEELRRRRANGERFAVLCVDYDIPYHNVSRIVRRVSYREP